MKRILFIFLPFITGFSQLVSMEKPTTFTSPIKIKKPYFDKSKQQYAINADYADFENAGHVHYKPVFHSMDRNNWKLISLWVDDDYRQKKIATHLFKALHDDIKERKGTHITWQVRPQAIYMEEHELVNYYKSMIRNVDAALLEKTTVHEVGPTGFEMTHMTVKIGDMPPEL